MKVCQSKQKKFEMLTESNISNFLNNKKPISNEVREPQVLISV
jgi:hypothetical protein